MTKSQRQRIAENIQRQELSDKLQRILQHANTIRNYKKDLQVSYNKWGVVNQQTIESLTELLNTILNISIAANAVSGIASFAEILGGVLSIAGAITEKRTLMETGSKISQGGNIANIGTYALKNSCLEQLCSRATNNFQKNKKYSDALEHLRYSYFHQLEVFKRELRTIEESSALPLLLETAQREGFDFLGDLGLDETVKSKLRINLRQMCRENTKKIKATTQMTRTQELSRVFARDIRKMLCEFKQLLKEDDNMFSIFSEETKKFLGDGIENLFPFVNRAESLLEQCSGTTLLRGGSILYRGLSSASRVEVGVMGGVHVFSGFSDLMIRIGDISNGSKSKESEELRERIEEMKEMRENIVAVMKQHFGWPVPGGDKTNHLSLTN